MDMRIAAIGLLIITIILVAVVIGIALSVAGTGPTATDLVQSWRP